MHIICEAGDVFFPGGVALSDYDSCLIEQIFDLEFVRGVSLSAVNCGSPSFALVQQLFNFR